ncbi:hypothetical protein [Niallia oryzisoli]
MEEVRQAFLVQLEGTSIINDIELTDRDGMEIVKEDIMKKSGGILSHQIC